MGSLRSSRIILIIILILFLAYLLKDRIYNVLENFEDIPPIFLYKDCNSGGWPTFLRGTGTFTAGVHFGSDMSYIIVPGGVTVIITGKTTPIYGVAGTGQSIRLIGPRELSFCDVGTGGGFNGFNDNIATIQIFRTGPECPSPPACPACPPPPPPCPDMTPYMLKSNCLFQKGDTSRTYMLTAD